MIKEGLIHIAVDVPQLLKHLCRVRTVQFNSHAPPFEEVRDQDIAAMIIQAAGTKAVTPCSRCRTNKGPFRGCFVVPTSAPISVRQAILGCANCYYHRRQSYCDLKRWSLITYPELRSTQPPNEAAATPATRTTKTEKQPERRSLRVVCKKSLKASIRKSESPRPAARSSRIERASNKADLPSSLSPSTFNPSQMLELETWEIAPGRIRCEGQSDTIYSVSLSTQLLRGVLANRPVDFAFSNAYLSQNQVVQIGRDISFHVITIKPGNIHSWEASPDKVRLCSIASGKLRVRMHDQEVSIGPNGLVWIQPGVSCTATNRLYIDAMVHVAAIPGDLC